MAEREVRYCTTEDGVRLAYCVEGEGRALLSEARELNVQRTIILEFLRNPNTQTTKRI
jgi:hypothetical protein